MSKGWPDPFHDRGDDFWDFDNMVNEYEYEQRRKAGKRQRQSKAPDRYGCRHYIVDRVQLTAKGKE